MPSLYQTNNFLLKNLTVLTELNLTAFQILSGRMELDTLGLLSLTIPLVNASITPGIPGKPLISVSNLPQVETVSFPNLVRANNIGIFSLPDATEISFDKLQKVDGDAYFQISSCSKLTKLNVPMLAEVGDLNTKFTAESRMQVDNNEVLESFEANALSMATSLRLTENPSLKSIFVPNAIEMYEIYIEGNPKLVDLMVGFRSEGNHVNVTVDRFSLANAAMESLEVETNIMNYIYVANNNNIKSIDFPSLTTLGTLVLGNHPGGMVLIKENDALQNVYFNDVTNVNVDMSFQGNNNLQVISMESLERHGESFILNPRGKTCVRLNKLSMMAWFNVPICSGLELIVNERTQASSALNGGEIFAVISLVGFVLLLAAYAIFYKKMRGAGGVRSGAGGVRSGADYQTI